MTAYRALVVVGLVMTTLAYGASVTTIEAAASRTPNDDMPLYVHPTWMPRELGSFIGSGAANYALMVVVVAFILAFWASMIVTRRMVRREFPRGDER